MRWLLLKDLQILRRSPLIVGLLVAYPVILGVLIGFALSGDGSKPRVAFFNEVAEDAEFQIGAGDEEIDRGIAREELCARVECVDVDSREEAEQKVEDGDVIAALILPPDLLDRLESLASLNPQQPVVEVLVNEDDPVKASLVDDRISALVTEANLILSQRISDQAATYLDLLIEGGRFTLPLLGELAEPIEVEKQVVVGDSAELDDFAIAVAVAVTLMFVTVLLVAGSLALEREENAFSRITRSLVGPGGLLMEKLALGIAASL